MIDHPTTSPASPERRALRATLRAFATFTIAVEQGCTALQQCGRDDVARTVASAALDATMAVVEAMKDVAPL